MESSKLIGTEVLDNIIEGRVVPHIYAFTTNTVPNYLKVGDTYRTVSKRLNEWRAVFPELEQRYQNKAIIDDEVYFRDYSVHKYLEKDLKKSRLLPGDIQDTYYSKEFFKNTGNTDLDNAILDIKENYSKNTGKYEYYSSNTNLPKTYSYTRGDNWELRPNQRQAVENFKNAVQNGRKNLLMYAVMRFGKSFTSLYCGLELGAKLILVLSAKADVREEWKKTVQSAGNFREYVFLDSSSLLDNKNSIKEEFEKGNKVVVFLTLQDLQGDKTKGKHKEILSEEIDLLIVDETHFGARAESFGKILKTGNVKQEEKNIKKFNKEESDIAEISEQVKSLNSKVRLHLSGTPYRILMGGEFEKEDIIAFVQFSDIVKDQELWDKENLNNEEVEEWENPYFGFPQMIRFAFNPSKSAREKMEELKKEGVSFAFSKLFEPQSIREDKLENSHKKFIHEKEILDLLQVIDGSKTDDNLLSFLDYDKLKQGKMCRHIVMVLPYCASCDAMEELIVKNISVFKNLGEYKVINISGVNSHKKYKTPLDIKNKIKEHESNDEKTITLTVNRMLTGSTVEQWDTMLYMKDTASPQEYDQAIFRLQNQYVRTLVNGENIIKENLKPQTLLVDFDPNRMFRIQEQKSLIYNVNTEKNGNQRLKERIEEELRISPIIVMNSNKIRQVEATNIVDAVAEYNSQRSVSDEVVDIPVDLSILEDEEIRRAIESQAEFNSKQGLSVSANQGEEDDLDMDSLDDSTSGEQNRKINETSSQYTVEPEASDTDIKKLESQIKTYYQRILFLSFLTKDRVSSLDDILEIIDNDDNKRLAYNLYLDRNVLEKLSKVMAPFKRNSLDYKIQNISKLANDESVAPLDRAITSINKFNRMSESEVITPLKVCKEMVDLLPEDGLREIVENQNKLLVIASKSGEYALAMYNRLTQELEYKHDEVKNIIYSIPTSPVAYEFTRKFYEILDLNIDNIANKFNAYDLIEVKTDNGKEIDYEKIENILKQDKLFCEITLEDELQEGGSNVKFGAVVGNPPYQVSDGGAQASSKPIYHYFVQIGKRITSNYTSYITPTRWFAGGKGLDTFRNEMLQDKSIVELHDFLTPEDIFPNTNNRGGICYFLTDVRKENSEVKILTFKNTKKISEMKRPLLAQGNDIFIRDNIAIEVIGKIKNIEKNYFDEIVSSRKPFGISSNVIKTNKFKFSKENMREPVLCFGKNRCIGFVEKEEITMRTEWINKWKVYVPRANNIGTELSDDNLNSFVGSPYSICTESYILVGVGIEINEDIAKNISKYLTTKFARFLHSQAKASQDASSKTYRFIPIQNFTVSSDIDWSKSVSDIDRQLFIKYNLSQEEIKHIDNSIKDMQEKI